MTPIDFLPEDVAAALADVKAYALAHDGRDMWGNLHVHANPCRASCCAKQTPMSMFDQISAYGMWSVFCEDLIALEAKVIREQEANKPQREMETAAAIAAYDMQQKAERVAIRVGLSCTKRPQAVNKIAQPCKFLYNCQGTPAKPTSKAVTTECWSWEYKDPKTGAMIKKHACDRLHPGEEGWLKQWQTDRTYKPAAAPAAPTRSWNQTPSRFEALNTHRNTSHEERSAW